MMTAIAEMVKSNAANDATVGPDEEGEIEDGPDKEESADIGFLADAVFCGEAPLADDPRGKE